MGQDVRQRFMGYKTVTKPDPAQACVRKVSFTKNGLHILKDSYVTVEPTNPNVFTFWPCTKMANPCQKGL